MVNELQARLHSLYNGRTPWGVVGPQTVGFERYRLVATGTQLYTLLEAADRIGELEAFVKRVANSDMTEGAPAYVIEARKLLRSAPETGTKPSDGTKDGDGVWVHGKWHPYHKSLTGR